MADFTPRYLKDYQAPQFSISEIALTVTLDDHKTKVESVLNIQKQGDHDSPLILDGEHLTLDSVSIDGRVLSEGEFTVTDKSLEISAQQSEFTLEVVTFIDPKGNTSLEGIFKSGDAFCSQCEAEGFRRITYYLDRPDVMAKFSCKIIADKAKYPQLLSNGNKIAFGDLDNGLHFVSWQDPFPKPSYLFALVAGDFDLLEDKFTTQSGREVALEIFVDKGNLHRAHHAMTSLKKSMSWDETEFDLEYDLDIYMIVAVDFFNMGAMENKGLNIFNSKYVLADPKTATDDDFFNVEAVIAHEYFHNWTGNRVTCRDWFQLSLKEGLTVFRDQQFSADMHSPAVTRIKNIRVLRAHQFPEDAGPMAHPIRPEKVTEMNNFYTLTVYEKGAEVIRMMHTLLGDEGFKKGIALYFERFDGMAVTCDDFVQAMSDASGIDLTQFSLWYRQFGTPVVKVAQQYDSQTKRLTLSFEQQSPVTERQPAPQALHMPVNIELIDTSTGKVSHRACLDLTEEKQNFVFDNQSPDAIAALFGGLSAPIKLEQALNDEQLLSIMVHAQDSFCRWDAGQQLLKGYIVKLVSEPDLELPKSLLKGFEQVLLNATQEVADFALIAEQLKVPSFNEVAEDIEEVDPQRLIAAIDKLELFIAENLASQLEDTYERCTQKTFLVDGQAIAKRALRNQCLHYLTKLEQGAELASAQYHSADNMTEQLAALQVSGANNLSCFDELMNHFEQQWQDTTLVMDKWFTLAGQQNTADIFERMDALLVHPKFTLENPNRARSLIAAFSANHKYFHCASGKGYALLANQLAKLDSINPQVASRLITPLIQYKNFDKQRQAKMLTELKKLKAIAGLSRDLSEKLNASI